MASEGEEHFVGDNAEKKLTVFFFFFTVNRSCRSGMYCSNNDRSKNRVTKTGFKKKAWECNLY